MAENPTQKLSKSSEPTREAIVVLRGEFPVRVAQLKRYE